MIDAFQSNPIQERQNEISNFLNGYGENDVWKVDDPFFTELRPEKWTSRINKVNFSSFPALMKDEVKYMFATRLQNREMRLTSVFAYSLAVNKLGKFLCAYYPNVSSIVQIPYDKALVQWRMYLINLGAKVKRNGKLAFRYYESIFSQLYSFFINFYDAREEMEKDIWDVRKISGTRITENKSNNLLDFTAIPTLFRDFAKRYLKFRLTIVSHSQASDDLMSLRLFLNFINEQYPTWNNLIKLTRRDMEDYLSWYRSYTKGWKRTHAVYITQLRLCLDYIQKAQYPDAPELPAILLLFREDIPKQVRNTENDIKYIPEGVLQQLEDNLECLTPSEYIPVVVLLRATGWRISDILSLKYYKCLDQTNQGWYLCGDIPKTQVLNHRVPITDEVATVVRSVVEEIREKSTDDNNPNKLLFVRFSGKRKGRCPQGHAIQRALNRLAEKQNIVDDQGELFHFGNHAFRHTKGVELINNGMNLLHVQKWMAHASPEMTLRYARLLDTCMRKSWEEATKQGLFKIDLSGRPTEINSADIQNEDLIEWEYIRSNLDAVRMPLGYCMKPKKQECHTQLNPCLTCRNLCTTFDFIPQYELEIQETRTMIERGKTQGRSIWVEKNEALLARYEVILTVLKEGKTHHKAGKKGREYVEEERNSVE